MKHFVCVFQYQNRSSYELTQGPDVRPEKIAVPCSDHGSETRLQPCDCPVRRRVYLAGEYDVQLAVATSYTLSVLVVQCCKSLDHVVMMSLA